ncbi:MAG: glutathione S-transferase domain-containing protein [Actinobacteria bacterium]|nr:glutathione S-transferase domain-containing protein [Actinomycetota bacterium]
MAVKLYRCSSQWVKIGAHPCWRVEKALMEAGVDYERVPGPVRRSKRDALRSGTGQSLYPAIQFEDGSWYREESADMARTIREGHLRDKDAGSGASAAELH